MPESALGSLLASFLSRTVTASPVNFVGNRGRMRWDMYILRPLICSSASETEATSTCRKPSSNAASSLAGAADCCGKPRGDNTSAAIPVNKTPTKTVSLLKADKSPRRGVATIANPPNEKIRAPLHFFCLDTHGGRIDVGSNQSTYSFI